MEGSQFTRDYGLLRLDAVNQSAVVEGNLIGSNHSGEDIGATQVSRAIGIAIPVVGGPIPLEVKLEALLAVAIPVAGEVHHRLPGVIRHQCHGGGSPAVGRATEVELAEGLIETGLDHHSRRGAAAQTRVVGDRHLDRISTGCGESASQGAARLAGIPGIALHSAIAIGGRRGEGDAAAVGLVRVDRGGAAGAIVQAGDVIGYLGMTGYSTKENVNNINEPHLHFGLQLIFDESQKECDSEIWIDVYPIIELLASHCSSVARDPQTGRWERLYPYCDLDAEPLRSAAAR